jgi:hypothetical protein
MAPIPSAIADGCYELVNCMGLSSAAALSFKAHISNACTRRIF